MKPFTSAGMEYDGDQFYILDQTLLPHQEKWVECSNTDTLIALIQRLAIRGAPAIGISASIILALQAKKGKPQDELIIEAQKLQSARPTAVNLKNNIELILESIKVGQYPQKVIETAEKIFKTDQALCDKIIENGVQLFSAGDKILTHCHTGGIATAGKGTALGIIAAAYSKYEDIFVWIDETRPLLQGGRLTAWECLKLKIPHKIICDNMAAMLMQKGAVSHVIVGSDRISTNGDFANKIGTYSLAVLAHYHDIPFYVAAPRTTIDPQCFSGTKIPIEERSDNEIKGVMGSFGSCSWAPTESEVFNPAFDVTPAELVTAWILDTGIYTKKDMKKNQWWV